MNLGGWLTIEPVSILVWFLCTLADAPQFITPALFEPYLNNAVVPIDEWTLSQAMSNDTANGGLQQLVTHYETFIVSLALPVNSYSIPLTGLHRPSRT